MQIRPGRMLGTCLREHTSSSEAFAQPQVYFPLRSAECVSKQTGTCSYSSTGYQTHISLVWPQALPSAMLQVNIPRQVTLSQSS